MQIWYADTDLIIQKIIIENSYLFRYFKKKETSIACFIGVSTRYEHIYINTD